MSISVQTINKGERGILKLSTILNYFIELNKTINRLDYFFSDSMQTVRRDWKITKIKVF